MTELAAGPACGVALFVTLAGGRVPRRCPAARPRVVALRWVWLGLNAAIEELVWRGVALGLLALAVGPVAALVVSTVAFAAWHAPALGRGAAVHLLTGAGFGAAYLVGGLGAAVFAHATYNVLVDWGVQAERSAA